MSDDIVTRLRGQMSNEFVIDHPNMVRVPTLYEQAADEIERLRADRDRWQVVCADLMEHLENALYSDEWRTREYAIAMFSIVEQLLPHWRDGRITEFER